MYEILVGKDLEYSALLDKDRGGEKHIALNMRQSKPPIVHLNSTIFTFGHPCTRWKYIWTSFIHPVYLCKVLVGSSRVQLYAALRATLFYLLTPQFCDFSIATTSIEFVCLPTKNHLSPNVNAVLSYTTVITLAACTDLFEAHEVSRENTSFAQDTRACHLRLPELS